MSLVKKIQKQPRHIRVIILWIIVILCAILIFVFWLIYLNSYLKGISFSQKETQVKEEVKKDNFPSLFSTLKDDLLLFKDKFQAGVNQILKPSKKGPGFEIEIVE